MNGVLSGRILGVEGAARTQSKTDAHVWCIKGVCIDRVVGSAQKQKEKSKSKYHRNTHTHTKEYSIKTV